MLTRSAPGQYSSYTYDKVNRKTSETLHGVTTTYTYDKAGNLASLTDAGGTVSYTYDAINRLATIVSPKPAGGTDTVAYDYNDPVITPDPATTIPDAQVAMILPGGYITRKIDVSGKLKEVRVNSGTTWPGTQRLRQQFLYTGDHDADPATANQETERLATSSLQIGDDTATPKVRDYTYTDVGQIKSMIESNGTTLAATTQFAYDLAGNRTSRVKTPASGPAATTSYAYNENNQLCWQANAASSTRCLGKSPGGIGTAANTAPYGPPPSGATTYTYDDAGNQITGGFTGSYDAKGRISGFNGIYSSILSPNNNEIIGLGSGNTFTNTQLGVQRITTGGTDTTQLVRSPGGDAISQIRSGVKRWLVTDHLGSTIALVDSSGVLQRTYSYDADGNSTSTPQGTGATPETPIKYAGGHDIGGGLYHYGARYYQPSTARWTQMDPLMQPADLGQANRYVYVGGDPLNGVDPSGLGWDDIAVDIGEKYVWQPLKTLSRAGGIYTCSRYVKQGYDKMRNRQRYGGEAPFYDAAEGGNRHSPWGAAGCLTLFRP